MWLQPPWSWRHGEWDGSDGMEWDGFIWNDEGNPPVNKHSWLGNPKWMKSMYLLLKNGVVFHCDLLVYQRVLGCWGTTVDGSKILHQLLWNISCVFTYSFFYILSVLGIGISEASTVGCQWVGLFHQVGRIFSIYSKHQTSKSKSFMIPPKNNLDDTVDGSEISWDVW